MSVTAVRYRVLNLFLAVMDIPAINASLLLCATSCQSIIRAEFVPSRCEYVTNTSGCLFTVLDLIFFVTPATDHTYWATVHGVDNSTGSTSYTSACRDQWEKLGVCNATLSAFVPEAGTITARDFQLCVCSVAFQLVSMFQVFLVVIPEKYFQGLSPFQQGVLAVLLFIAAFPLIAVLSTIALPVLVLIWGCLGPGFALFMTIKRCLKCEFSEHINDVKYIFGELTSVDKNEVRNTAKSITSGSYGDIFGALILVIGAISSPIALMGFTVAKLFPSRYKCQTQLCMRMVHTACMTLSALFFELVEMLCMHNIKRYSFESEQTDMLFIPASVVGFLKFFATLSKAGGLILSLAWLVLDLLDLRAGVPGPGTLALSYVITVINVLVVLLELFSWVLLFPEALKHFREAWKNPSEEPSLLTFVDSTKTDHTFTSQNNTSAELVFSSQ